MKIESASRGGAEISGENRDVFKLGPYSYRNMQDRQKLNDQQHKSGKKYLRTHNAAIAVTMWMAQ